MAENRQYDHEYQVQAVKLGTVMLFLELYFDCRPVPLRELYEKGGGHNQTSHRS